MTVQISKYKFQIHRALVTGEYYWNVSSRNGREIARSSETYKRHGACVRSLENLIYAIEQQVVSVEDNTATITSSTIKTRKA